MMKAWKKAVALLLVLSAALPFGACSGKSPQEDGQQGASDGKVAFDTTLMNEYAHENAFTITPTAEGLKMECVQNLKGACSKMRFPIGGGEQLSLTFAVPVYKEDSEERIVTGVNMHTQDTVDILLRGQTAQQPVAQLRIWGTSSAAESVSGRVTWRMNGESAVYHSDFTNANALPYAETKKITGNARASTPFTIVFDTEHLFQSYVDGDRETLVPLLDETKAGDKAVIDGIKAAFAGVRSVSLIIRCSGPERKDLEEDGMTGFEASSCIVLKELNGQSLCCAEERIADTAKPYISAPALAEGTQLAAYTDYTYEVKTNEKNEAGVSTVLYSAFATDVLSWKELTYSLIITMPDGTVTQTEGLTFSTGAAGEYKVKAAVRDASGNQFVSSESTFTAKDTYRINVEGEIPATASVGSTFKVPAAYVTNAEGSRTDANGNPYPCTVEVFDLYFMEVAVGADGTITFSEKGVYTITYSSTSADGSARREYRITVS